MSKQIQTIIIVAVVLVAAYFFMQNQSTTVSPSAAAPPITPGGPPSSSPPVPGQAPGLPVMSQPAAVSTPATQSLPAPQSLMNEVITPLPVAVASTPSVFAATTTDAEQTGNAAQASTPAMISPLANYPSGFQTWANSLGPLNKSHLINILPSMSSTDVNFINNMVISNLWGHSSVAAQWNAFVSKYGFPVSGSFNNFQ